jgi:hypothetical protein
MYKHGKKNENKNQEMQHAWMLHIKMDENYWNFIHSKDIKHF